MGRSASHKSKADQPRVSVGRGAESRASAAKRPAVTAEPGIAPARLAELEAELAQARQALRDERTNHDEDAENFAKTLARLAQSERALSQAQAKVVRAEARAEAAETRAEAAEARAEVAEARTEAAEARAEVAEAREQEALTAARVARSEQAAASAEVKSLRSEASDLHTEWTELSLQGATLQKALDACHGDLAAAEARIDAMTHERTRLLDLLASLEVLGREITQLTNQATAEGTSLPKVECWLGRDVEAEHVRATVRPEGMSAPPAQASRSWSTPEIVVDGRKLES